MACTGHQIHQCFKANSGLAITENRNYFNFEVIISFVFLLLLTVTEIVSYFWSFSIIVIYSYMGLSKSKHTSPANKPSKRV